MQRVRRGMAVVLMFSIIISGTQFVPGKGAEAASTMQLSKKKLTLSVNNSKKLIVKNKKGKVVWKSSNKKVATVSRKGTVKARKKGKATISAVVTYKKKKKILKCKVTVKKGNNKKDAGNTPSVQQKPEDARTTNVNKGNENVGDTNPGNENSENRTPDNTQLVSQSPAPTVTNDPSEGIVEEDANFTITGIVFENEQLTYELSKNNIFVDIGNAETLKKAVPDVQKCSFEGVYNNISYENLQVYQVIWHDDPYFSSSVDSGYYEFKLRLVDDAGKVHYLVHRMIENCYPVSSADGSFSLTSIQYEGEEYLLEPGSESNQFIMHLKKGEKIKDIIPDLEQATLTAFWKDKKVEIEEISDVQWSSWSYYSRYDRESSLQSENSNGYYRFTVTGKNGTQNLKKQLVITGDNDILFLTGIKGNTNTFQICEDSDSRGDYYTCLVPDGMSLNEYIKDPEKDLSFVCNYLGKTYETVSVSKVRWHEANEYYSFQLSVTVDEEVISRKFSLYGESEEKGVTVSGVLRNHLSEPMGNKNQYIDIEFRGSDDNNRYVYPDEQGNYSVILPPDTYEVQVQGKKVEEIVVDAADVSHDIKVDFLYKVSGSIYRKSVPCKGCYVTAYKKSGSNWQYFGEVKADGNSYRLYLPENDYRFDVDGVPVAYVTVSGNDVEKDIDTNFCQVKGSVYLKNKELFGCKGLIFRSESGQYTRCAVDKHGRYCVELAPENTYSIYLRNNSQKIGSVSVDKEDVEKDILLDAVKITGVLRAKNGDIVSDYVMNFYDEGGKRAARYIETDAKGRYEVYLNPGIYRIKSFSGGIICPEFVVDDHTEKDILGNLYKVSGTVRNLGKIQQDFYGTISRYNKKYKYYRSMSYRFLTDKDGKYCVYLPKGTYKFDSIKVKVVDAEIQQDLDYSIYRVVGEVLLRENVPAEWYTSLWVYNSKKQRVQYLQLDFQYGFYEIKLSEPGEYTVCDGMGQIVYDTFTVTEAYMERDIVLNQYKLSGFVEGIYSNHFRLEDQNGNGVSCSVGSYSDRIGVRFESCVRPGTYYLKCSKGMDYELNDANYVVVATFEVTDQDITGGTYTVTRYPEMTCYIKQANGDLLYQDCKTIRFRNEKGEYTYAQFDEKGVAHARLKPGQFSVYFDEKTELGTVTMGTEDTEAEIVTDLVWVSGMYRVADDFKLESGWITFTSNSTKVVYSQWIDQSTNRYGVYLPIGQYKVRYQKSSDYSQYEVGEMSVTKDTTTYDLVLSNSTVVPVATASPMPAPTMVPVPTAVPMPTEEPVLTPAPMPTEEPVPEPEMGAIVEGIVSQPVGVTGIGVATALMMIPMISQIVL